MNEVLKGPGVPMPHPTDPGNTRTTGRPNGPLRDLMLWLADTLSGQFVRITHEPIEDRFDVFDKTGKLGSISRHVAQERDARRVRSELWCERCGKPYAGPLDKHVHRVGAEREAMCAACSKDPESDFLDEVATEYRRLMAPLWGTAIPVKPGESPDDACARVKAEVYADAERTVKARRAAGDLRFNFREVRFRNQASPPDPFADAADMVALAEAKTGHGIVIGGPLGPRCLTHDCAVVRNAEDTAWVCASTAEAPDATTCTRDRDVLTASGRALDLYGARVGVYRQKGESDAGFRASILCRKDLEEQTRERVVTALVSGSPLHPSGCGFADPTKRCVICELASRPWEEFEAERRGRHLGSEAAAYGRLHAGAVMRGRTYRDAFGQLRADGTRRGGQ